MSDSQRLPWLSVRYLPFVSNEGNDCHYFIIGLGRVTVSRCLGRWISGARWITAADTTDRCQPPRFTTGPWVAAKKKRERERERREKQPMRRGFNTRYKKWVIQSQWALIATWNQSQVRMPKQAARFSVPVFLGTAHAKSPNAFVTSNISPFALTPPRAYWKTLFEDLLSVDS